MAPHLRDKSGRVRDACPKHRRDVETNLAERQRQEQTPIRSAYSWAHPSGGCRTDAVMQWEAQKKAGLDSAVAAWEMGNANFLLLRLLCNGDNVFGAISTDIPSAPLR